MLGMLLLILSVVCVPCAAGIKSDFTYGSDGWRVWTSQGYDGAPTWNSAGYVYTHDPDGGDTAWKAPSKFLGNISSAYNRWLKFDELVVPVEGSILKDPLAIPLVIIDGGGGNVLTFFSSVTPTTVTSFSIRLAEYGGWHFGMSISAPAPTHAQMLEVMDSVLALGLKAEYYANDEINYLDNVEITPEPCGLLVLVSALGYAGALTRRRKR